VVRSVSYTATDTSDSITSSSVSVSWTVGTPASLTLARSANNVTVGTNVTITATVKDTYSNNVSGETITLIDSDSNSYTVTDNNNGTYSFTVTRTVNTTITYTASDTAYSLTNTITVTYLPGSLSTLTITTADAIKAINTNKTISVTATDTYGNLLTGKTINLTGDDSSTYTPTSSSGGTYTFTVTSSSVGAVIYTANSGTIHSNTVTITWITHGDPTSITLSGTTTNIQVTKNTTLTATIKDANNISVSGETVTLTGDDSSSYTPINGGNGDGTYSFTVTSSSVGTVVYTAHDAAFSLDSNTISINYLALGPPTTITLASSNTTLTVGSNNTLTSTVTDSNSFRVPGQIVKILNVSSTDNTDGTYTSTVTNTVAETVNYTSSVYQSINNLIPSMSGLYAWYDGADLSTITTSSDRLTQWTDKTGHNYNATPVTNYDGPTINPNGGLYFNGSNYLQLPNGAIPYGDASYTIVAVTTNSSSNFGAIIGGGDPLTANGSNWLYINSGGSGRPSNFWPTNSLDSQYQLGVGDTSILYCDYASGGTRKLYTNITADLVSDTPGTRVQANNYNYIGVMWNTYYNIPYTGTINEILVFNSVLTTPQKQLVEGYLAWKWNIKNYLPSNHPYKNTNLSSLISSSPVSVSYTVGAAYAVVITASTTTIQNGSNVSITAKVVDRYNNPIPNKSISLTRSSGSTLSGTSNSNGLYVFTVTSILATTITYTATHNSFTSNSISVTYTPGIATNLTLSSSTLSATVGDSITLTATLKDSNNNNVSGQTVAINDTISTTDNGDGTYTASRTNTVAQTYTYTATQSTLTSNTVSVDYSPGAPNSISISVSPTTQTVGSSVTITATILDLFGNGISGQSIVLTGDDSSTQTHTTSTGGIYEFSKSSTVAGTVNYTVSGTGSSSGISSSSVAVIYTAGTPTTIEISQSAESKSVGAIANITITLKDTYNNYVPGQTVVIHASDSSTITVTDNNDGTYSGPVSSTVTGSITYYGTCGSLTSSNKSVLWTHGPETSIFISGGNTSVIKNTNVTLTVTDTDAYSNGIAGQTINITDDITTPNTYTGTDNGDGTYTFSVTSSTATTVNYTANNTVTNLSSSSVSVQYTTDLTSLTLTGATTVTVNTNATITATVLDATGTAVINDTVTVAGDDSSTYTATNNNDGTYSFSVTSSVATTVNYTASDTTYSLTSNSVAVIYTV